MIVAHARACLPDECCGLLAIDEDGSVVAAHPVTNANPSPTTFTLDPAEHLGATLDTEAAGWEIGGVFHSHPAGAAVPSTRDLTGGHPVSWLHVIVGFEPSIHLRAWRSIDGEVTEVALG